MRILLLVQDEQRVILDKLYEAIVAAVGEGEIRRLNSAQQADLRSYFKNVDVTAYERIVLFLRFKKEIRQRRFLRTLPRLVFLEHDAYQNYIPGKYQGAFSKHYAALPWVRVVSSGFLVVEQLRAEGIDAVFVPKGYDQLAMCNRRLPRDIELAFLGSIQNQAYDGRRSFLEALAEREKLLVTRTNSGEEYVEMLNRIRFFVSADVGMGEYMIKNFEAMACGCLLFAFDQGDAENTALGLQDMHNVVLYRNLDDCQAKLQRLRADPELADSITAAGCALAQARFGYDSIARAIADALQPPLRKPVIRRLLGFPYSVGWA
ncbi:MAG TPA: glycosyltransferase [Accumulibacter sp.]|nr:glycosyltransferase [Accumulibacter sp.]